MKILESRPRVYDRRIDVVSRGRVGRMKKAVASRIPKNALVLEIGCGTGELAVMMAGRGAIIHGFDSNLSMVEAAGKRITAEGLTDSLTVWPMGVDGLNGLPDETYEAVVSTLVFSEFSDDERLYAFKHIHRVLRPNGFFILADEVRPQTAGGRLVHGLARAPLAALTALVSGSLTRPLIRPREEIAAAGFSISEEMHNFGGALVVFVARRPDHQG